MKKTNCLLALIFIILSYPIISFSKSVTQSEFIGMHSLKSVDSLTQLFIFDDNTFCYAFMGGNLNLLKAGRWTITSDKKGINLKEIRLNESVHPAMGNIMDRFGPTKVGINFDGYMLSNAYSPVFAVSSNDTLPTTFRPLFPNEQYSWSQTYVLPLMDPEEARYIFIGDVIVDEYNEVTRKLRITKYKIEGFDAVRVGFNKMQAADPLDVNAYVSSAGLQIDGRRYSRRKSMPRSMVAEVRSQCILPVLEGTENISARKTHAEKNTSRKILTPIETYSLDTSVIAGEPIFNENYDNEIVATDSMDAIIETEKEQLQIAFKKAINNLKDVDEFMQLASNLTLKENRIKNHAPLIVELFSKLLVKTVVKAFRSDNFKVSEHIFTYFVKNIYPATVGFKNRKLEYNYSVVASQGLIITTKIKNKDIDDMVFNTLLGENFDISTHKNRTMIYNLACYYSVNKDKKNMLIAIANARQRGVPAKQFLKDLDFKNYINDPDFMSAVKG